MLNYRTLRRKHQGKSSWPSVCNGFLAMALKAWATKEKIDNLS